jgi:hypothetical protein
MISSLAAIVAIFSTTSATLAAALVSPWEPVRVFGKHLKRARHLSPIAGFFMRANRARLPHVFIGDTMILSQGRADSSRFFLADGVFFSSPG